MFDLLEISLAANMQKNKFLLPDHVFFPLHAPLPYPPPIYSKPITTKILLFCHTNWLYKNWGWGNQTPETQLQCSEKRTQFCVSWNSQIWFYPQNKMIWIISCLKENSQNSVIFHAWNIHNRNFKTRIFWKLESLRGDERYRHLINKIFLHIPIIDTKADRWYNSKQSETNES